MIQQSRLNGLKKGGNNRVVTPSISVVFKSEAAAGDDVV